MSAGRKQASKIINEQYIPRKLKHLLNNPYKEKKSALVIELLDKFKKNQKLTFETTSIANVILLEENDTRYTEKYKDFLKKNKLCTSYFEIPRLLRNDQYEQAVLLGLEEYDRLSQNEYLLKDKIASSLRLYNILEEASSRNDTQIILTLVEKMQTAGIIHSKNLSGILANAMNKQNDTILIFLFDFVVKNDFTDVFYEQYISILVQHNEVDKAIQILSHIESVSIRNRSCLEILSSLEFDECIEIIKLLLQSGSLSRIDYHNLPASFLSLPNLVDFENIGDKLNSLKEYEPEEIKQLIIYCLLSSLDNTNVHLTNTIFLLNGLQLHKHLLNESHKDIVFHQISKYPMKLTSIKLYRYFKSLNLNISKQNLFHILRAQCHGEEYDTFYYFLVELLSEYGELSPQVIELIHKLQKSTKDERLKLFLVERFDIAKIKELINYEFIEKNLEYQRERSKSVHSVIKGFTKYDYEKDIRLADSFNF